MFPVKYLYFIYAEFMFSYILSIIFRFYMLCNITSHGIIGIAKHNVLYIIVLWIDREAYCYMDHSGGKVSLCFCPIG